MIHRILRRLGIGAVLTAVAVGLVAAPAAAHVSVNPKEATAGGYAKLAFRVPNERDVPTTKLQVILPENQPFASVSVRPVPGWKAELTRTKLATPIESHGRQITEAVTEITWTSETPAGIGVGQFQEFEISVGPMPEQATTLVFKALQTYADNEVVRWIDENPEAEKPAATLKVVGASPSPVANASSTEDSSNGLGIAALVVAIVALAGAGFAVARSVRRS